MTRSFIERGKIAILFVALSIFCALGLSAPAYASDDPIVLDAQPTSLIENGTQAETLGDTGSFDGNQEDLVKDQAYDEGDAQGAVEDSKDNLEGVPATDFDSMDAKQDDGATQSELTLADLSSAPLTTLADETPTATSTASTDIPMYRLYNAYTGEHLYTKDKNERNTLVKIGWFYEGIGWMAPAKGESVHRLYNPYSGDHHYTLSVAERDALTRIGWRYEGVGWYSLPSSDSSRAPLYRQFNPYESVGTHNYTLSKEENDALVKVGWRGEGVGWYGHTVPADFKDDMSPWKAHISGDDTLDRFLDNIIKSHGSLRSCYDYVKGFSYINGTKFWSNPRILPDSTTIPFAKKMLSNNGGNCYQYASLFSWLARGLGYDAQVISGWVQSYSGGKAPHGWVEIKQNGKTYVCDPDMAHELPNHNWYMVSYADAPIGYYNW